MPDQLPYAFVGLASAFEALRQLATPAPRWPGSPRRLPQGGSCAATQKAFKHLDATGVFSAHGIITRPVDLLVASEGMRSSGRGARYHVFSRPVPTGSFLRLDRRLLVSTPELAIIQLMSTQAKLDGLLDAFAEEVRVEREVRLLAGSSDPPILELATTWESVRRIVKAAELACEFAGTYRRAEPGGRPNYGIAPLMGIASLRDMLAQSDAHFAERRVMRVADAAFEGSASPMETSLALMLTMPLDLGGFGLPKPLLNVPIGVAPEQRLAAGRAVVTPDMLWEGAGVALEYDSAEFHRHSVGRPAQDALRSNLLASLGYVTLRVTPELVRTLSGVELLAEQLASRLGCTLQPPDEIQSLRRRKVFRELFPHQDGMQAA